jgi:hypothetical protein
MIPPLYLQPKLPVDRGAIYIAIILERCGHDYYSCWTMKKTFWKHLLVPPKERALWEKNSPRIDVWNNTMDIDSNDDQDDDDAKKKKKMMMMMKRLDDILSLTIRMTTTEQTRWNNHDA